MKMSYPCKITKEGDSHYLVEFVDFDEAFTEGENMDEALFNAAEVLSLTLEQRIDDGEEIPAPSKGKYKHFIAPEAGVQSAALLYRLKTDDISIADIARTLGTSWPSVQRLFKPKHSPTLKQLEKAVNAMGKKLVLTVE